MSFFRYTKLGQVHGWYVSMLFLTKHESDLIVFPCFNVLINPYKSVSGYLYFRNTLKDIKDHLQAYMVICKIFPQLMVTVFKENLNLQLPLIFYSSAMFVFETVFISEQIAGNSFRAL